MAETPPTSNSSPKRPENKPLIPPDERFWQRYSPHFEFPVSICSSAFLHTLVLGMLAFLPFLFMLIGLDKDAAPLPTDTIVIAGGGGHPEGVGNAPGNGVLPTQEDTKQPQTPEKEQVVTQPKDPQLAPVEPKKPDLSAVTQNSEGTRYIEESNPVSSRLDAVGKKARKRLEGLLAGKGQGGPGRGGGKGKGVGTGEGDLEGPGKANMSQREKRKNRWVMIFNTRDGYDYLNQLKGLGAILAIPDGDSFRVIRDLKRRPVEAKYEDLSKINRIYWIDDKPESVRSLTSALGLGETPPYIVAFFPLDVEKDLLDKELKAFRGKEDDIEETVFKVEQRGGSYEPVVTDQRRKR
jgi:hypothetical protein